MELHLHRLSPCEFAHGRAVGDSTTIEGLGLSSLERVELMMALEDRFQTRVDEGRFADATSVADLRALVGQPVAAASIEDEPVDFPSWNRTWPVQVLRRLSLAWWILPLARAFACRALSARRALGGRRARTRGHTAGEG